MIGDGISTETAFRSKAARGAPFIASIQLSPHVSPTDGSPLRSWSVVLARAGDWTATNADADYETIFGIDLPDSIDTFAELKAFLQSKVVGDIPAVRRQALNAKLTARGIDTSQVTLQTTWWQVLRGIYRHLNGGVDLNGDGAVQ